METYMCPPEEDVIEATPADLQWLALLASLLFQADKLVGSASPGNYKNGAHTYRHVKDNMCVKRRKRVNVLRVFLH